MEVLDGDEMHAKVNWTPTETESVLQLDEMGRAAAESGLNLEVEQGVGASYMFSHTHAGILKVAPLSSAGSKRTLDEEGDVEVEETRDLEKIDLSRGFGVRCVAVVNRGDVALFECVD
jgi:hypothetical protein